MLGIRCWPYCWQLRALSGEGPDEPPELRTLVWLVAIAMEVEATNVTNPLERIGGPCPSVSRKQRYTRFARLSSFFSLHCEAFFLDNI